MTDSLTLAREMLRTVSKEIYYLEDDLESGEIPIDAYEDEKEELCKLRDFLTDFLKPYYMRGEQS